MPRPITFEASRARGSSSPDLEKHPHPPDYDTDSDSDSSENEYSQRKRYSYTSSRSTSGSHHSSAPMLPQSSTSRKTPAKSPYRPPSRCATRYLCLALFTTLVIFIGSLIRASHVSQKQLEMGPVEKTGPPRPPPWEQFPFLRRYFGGVRSIVPKGESRAEYPSDGEEDLVAGREGQGNETVVNEGAEGEKKVEKRDEPSGKMPKSVPFNPYQKAEEGYAEQRECFLDQEEKVRIPQVYYYEGVPQGMPDPVIGAHEVLGLRDDVCFDRFGRLGAYGYGYSVRKGGSGAGLNGETEGADDMWTGGQSIPEVDFRKVKWVDAQDACFGKNENRFENRENRQSTSKHLFTNAGIEKVQQEQSTPALRRRGNRTISSNNTMNQAEASGHRVKRLSRTAIVVRTWWDHEYTLEEIVYLRSLIAELSLLSGGEYTIHFSVHVKDDNVPIWAEKQIYDRVLENSLPEEFRGMGSLWSERQMSLIYGGLEESFFRDLPVHGVYRGLYMALQYFSNQHPEYEHLWNWELDVRYTGHWYHLFDQIRQWTKDQPRKGLWERNGRFYIPSVHGSWEDFKQMVRVQSEMGTDSPNNIWSGLKAGEGGVPGLPQGKTDKPVWGPESAQDMLDNQDDPVPPTSIEKDHYEWGVGEEADLITFSPLFDPDGTTWFYTDDVTGYNTTTGLPPRRAAIGASSRLSRRLLQTMHRETILKRHHMFSEMWPASIALQHGFKAVYAPHPVYVDRRWPTKYLADVMNGGRNGASGGARTSVYGGREHNFKGQTWFYDAGFSPNLWRRWLGYKVDNDGGEQEEIAGEGRMCLPAMLLHPIKGIELVVEGGKRVDEEEINNVETMADAELDWER